MAKKKKARKGAAGPTKASLQAQIDQINERIDALRGQGRDYEGGGGQTGGGGGGG